MHQFSQEYVDQSGNAYRLDVITGIWNNEDEIHATQSYGIILNDLNQIILKL